MAHDIFELVKALAWPLVTLYALVKFGPGLTALFDELPKLIRRLRSAQGLGIEIELERLNVELPSAEMQAQSLELKLSTKEHMKIGVEPND